MNFDDKAKDLIKALLMEKMMEDRPAEISAKIKEGEILLHFSGRGVDILMLAFEIAEEAAKKIGVSCEDFCAMLKDGWEKKDSDVEKNFKNIFGDLFKDCD